MKHLYLAPLIALILTGSVVAQDRRISERPFRDGVVVRLEGCMNFQTMITFGAGEKIENVGLGDSNQWQVLPNKRADLLFVKPLVPKAYSNMTVVTDRHSYGFELKMASPAACARGDVLYNLKFVYAEDKVADLGLVKPVDAESLLPQVDRRNMAYSYQGASDLIPVRVFDDGASTWFKWAEGVSAPAVYALGPDNSESLVNYSTQGGYFVVDLVGRAFVLRRGAQTAILYNDRFSPPVLDAQSPQQRAPDDKDKAQKQILTSGSHK
jgi:type IV secretion system protein VirB9